ncbi:MAG: PDC sensor domain-containing protein, partial [Phycisphaerales bacterium]
MLSRLPIKVTAPLLMAAPAFVIGLVVTLLWNHQSRNAVHELASRNIEQVHLLASNKVDEVLSVPVRVCELNEHLVESGVFDPADLPAWRETFVRQSSAFDMLSSIVWGGADGRSAWVTRYGNGSQYWAIKDTPGAGTMRQQPLGEDGVPEGASTEFAFDLFARPWFTTVRDAGAPAWSDPYVWVGGDDTEPTLGISYGIPIFGSNGAFRGVVDADYSLNDLSRFLRSIEVGQTGVAALLDRNGALL